MADSDADRLSVLPCEIIVQVLRYLSAPDTAKMAQCCRTLRHASQIDSVWQHFCYRDYGVESKEGWGAETSYHDLYTKVLFSYGRVCGLWNCTRLPVGVLIYVKLEVGQIVGYNILPPPLGIIGGHLHCSTKLFQVVLENSQRTVLCRLHHHATLKLRDNKLFFKCEDCEKIALHLEDREFQQVARQMLQTDFTFADFGPEATQNNLEARLSYVTRGTRLWSKYRPSRVVFSPPVSIAPIQLGVYKGSYGSHGVELIHMTMARNGYELLGIKLLGDLNVPAGQTSISIDLRCRMELSEDQQHELFMLKKFKPHQLPDPRPLPPDASEPFDRDAISFLRHDPEEVPNTCRGRYLAEGRIADQGFRKPTWCRTHFIVFSEEFFGVFWLDLYSFSVFRRVAEDLGDPF